MKSRRARGAANERQRIGVRGLLSVSCAVRRRERLNGADLA